MEYHFVLVEPHEPLIPQFERILTSSYAADMRSFSDFRSALEYIREARPSLILAAVSYEAADLDFLRALDEDPHTRSIPVIAMTSFPGILNETGVSYERHCDARFTKPFAAADLVARVDRLLHFRRDPDLALLSLGVESPGFDYKEALDLSTRDGRASLAKDVIAMANSGGGRLVIGVREERPGVFVQTGLTDDQLELLETTRLNSAVQAFLDPPVSLAPRTVRDRGRAFCIIEVPSSGESLVLAARENDAANLRCGRVYIRTSAAASAEVRSSGELRTILERILAARLQASRT